MSIFDRLKSGIATNSPEETIQWASEFARAMPENQVVTLSGDLGAGKTVWVKGMAKSLSIDESVVSPSFNIYQVYQGRRQLIHMDAYRLQSAEQLDALLIDELLEEPWLVAYEWPERGLCDWMQGRIWRMEFSIQADMKHAIRLIAESEDLV